MDSQSDIQTRISNKATELFMQYGIRNISMDEIASSLGISKKTIYQNFKNKNALVMRTIDDMIDADACASGMVVENAIQEAFSAFDDTMESFDKMNFSILNELKKYHPKAYRKFEAYRNEFLLGAIKSSIERGIEEGVFRADINTEVIARLRVETLFVSFCPEFSKHLQVGFYEMNKQIFYLFMYGMATKKGYALIEKYKKLKQNIA